MSKHYCPLCMGKFDAKSSCIELHGRVIEDERSVTVCPYCGCTDVKEVEDDNTVRNAIDVRDVEKSE